MPTALELSQEEWQSYIDAALRRSLPSELTPAQLREREELIFRARQVSDQLKARFGAKRVVLFGSVLDPIWFAASSDVDLAVEGLAPDRFWEAWGLAEDVFDDRAVDLIEIETARPSLLRAIERYGIEL